MGPKTGGKVVGGRDGKVLEPVGADHRQVLHFKGGCESLSEPGQPGRQERAVEIIDALAGLQLEIIDRRLEVAHQLPQQAGRTGDDRGLAGGEAGANGGRVLAAQLLARRLDEGIETKRDGRGRMDAILAVDEEIGAVEIELDEGSACEAVALVSSPAIAADLSFRPSFS